MCESSYMPRVQIQSCSKPNYSLHGFNTYLKIKEKSPNWEKIENFAFRFISQMKEGLHNLQRLSAFITPELSSPSFHSSSAAHTAPLPSASPTSNACIFLYHKGALLLCSACWRGHLVMDFTGNPHCEMELPQSIAPFLRLEQPQNPSTWWQPHSLGTHPWALPCTDNFHSMKARAVW